MIVLGCRSPEHLYFVASGCCAWIGFYIWVASIGATHLGITMQQFHNNSSVLSANQRARKLCEVLQITCSPPIWHAFLCCCDVSKVWRKGCATNRRLPNIAMLHDAFYENSAGVVLHNSLALEGERSHGHLWRQLRVCIESPLGCK